jgi:hypothetical protein
MNVIPFKENREMHVVSLSRETTEVAFAYFAKELSVRF